MPYAILAGALPPERMGVYMGIFNFFIVLPEILAALTFGPIVKNWLRREPRSRRDGWWRVHVDRRALAQWVKETPATRAG